MTSSDEQPAAGSTKVVSFRLPLADHAAYQAMLEASGLKPGVFFHDVVLSGKVKISAKPRQKQSADYGRLVYLINKAGNNINQLAHRANTAHQAGKVSEETYSGILADLQTLAYYMKATLKDAD